MKKLLFLFLFLSHAGWSQEINRYMVFFTDKDGSSYSITKPEEFLTSRAISRRISQNIALTQLDLPVSVQYVQQVQEFGIPVYFRSRWMNAVLVEDSPDKVKLLSSLPFVERIEYVAPGKRLGARRYSTHQKEDEPITQHELLGVTEMHAHGFTGKGKMIAVLDDGFRGVNTGHRFDHLYRNNQLPHSRDFVGNNPDVYQYDDHGTKALSTIAVVDSGTFIGVAPDATFLLAVTEDVSSEYIIEEYNWLFAAEWADSLGADIISSSLGYYTFNDPAMNHRYSDLDGKTTVAARAANWATQRGMLVVVSAGNSRGSSWGKISTPADADQILSVGAVNNGGEITYFSSPGPTADGRIKPDVVAMGLGTTVVNAAGNYQRSNGTSFSGPQIAGLAAGVWQAFPYLTNLQLREAIIKSANLFATPDNDYGYGLPHFSTILELSSSLEAEEIFIFPNPVHQFQHVLQINRKFPSLKPVQINILDVTGRLVSQQQLRAVKSGTWEADVYNLPTGMYHLQVIYDKGHSMHKFLRL
ncbi:peptidase S8 and S53 subtilisin kexin sedolisin [Flammeovirgaceae bacterium 311]|nr:peptidase S8 and S53 subtilisin kexin sedolisin [Flammeovirgaceae bacterium 311]